MRRSGSGREAVYKMPGERLLGQGVGIGRFLAEEPLHGVHDLRPAAVVQGQDDDHPAVVPGLRFQPLELPQDGPGDPVLLPDDHQAEVVLAKDLAVLLQIVLEKRPELRDLLAGTLPVLLGEGEKGEDLYAQAGRGFDDLADGIGSRLVPVDAGKPPLPGPPAVAVHDDGDVTREPGSVQATDQGLLFRAGRDIALEAFKHVDHYMVAGGSSLSAK